MQFLNFIFVFMNFLTCDLCENVFFLFYIFRHFWVPFHIHFSAALLFTFILLCSTHSLTIRSRDVCIYKELFVDLLLTGIFCLYVSRGHFFFAYFASHAYLTLHTLDIFLIYISAVCIRSLSLTISTHCACAW